MTTTATSSSGGDLVASNTLACLYALASDSQARGALGDNVEIVVHAYEETHTIIPVGQIVRRIRAGGGLA